MLGPRVTPRHRYGSTVFVSLGGGSKLQIYVQLLLASWSRRGKQPSFLVGIIIQLYLNVVVAYGAPFSHLFTELKISPIEVHISAIQL